MSFHLLTDSAPVYFGLPLIPFLFANTGILRPIGLKENTASLPRHCMPRRSSLPYDTTTLTSLLDPLTFPTGNITVIIKCIWHCKLQIDYSETDLFL